MIHLCSSTSDLAHLCVNQIGVAVLKQRQNLFRKRLGIHTLQQ